MARVIRLPSGRVFRAEPLVDDPKKLGMGNKGAFDFSETVKLLDQVAESKGIGAVANLVEKGYDAVRGDVKRPGEEEKDKGPADALTQAAKARVRKPSAGMRMPTPDQERGPLFPANQEARRQAMMRKREVPAVQQVQRPPYVQENLNLRLQGEAPSLKEQARLRLGEPMQATPQQQVPAPLPPIMTAPVQPAIPFSQFQGTIGEVFYDKQGQPVRMFRDEKIVPEQVFARGPQPVPNPGQIAAPPIAPIAAVPTQPAPGMAGGGAPLTEKTMPAQAVAAGQQVAANVLQEAQRTQPVAAAEVDMTRFQSPTGQARGSIEYFSELADALKKRGIGLQEGTQAPMEIPYTVSIDELYGYARNARTLENQKRVLDALANNRVTGMGFETLADRLSGKYRQRYLANVVAQFPKQARQPNLIDAVSAIGRGYASEQLGRRRERDIRAGAPEAGVAKTRAQAFRAAAGGQRAAEQAVTEREGRASKIQAVQAKAVGGILDKAIKMSKRKGRGGRGKPKINLRVFQTATSGNFDREQQKLESQISKFDDQIARLTGIANTKITMPTRAQAAINPTGAKAQADAYRKQEQAKLQLQAVIDKRTELQGLYDSITEQRKAIDALVARMATGYRPTQAELDAAGISATKAIELMQGFGGLGGRRRGTKRKPAKPKTQKKPKAKIKF